jgi:hypothetical protein
MSWDATLCLANDESCPNCGHELAPPYHGDALNSWNYTHNTNGMIASAYEAVSGEATPECGGSLGPVIGAAWWGRLSGADGPAGAAYLGQIIKGLEADPGRFRAMNPENGWGDYEGLLGVLREMRDAVPADRATLWHVSG